MLCISSSITRWEITDLEELCAKLVLLLGDFNAHSRLGMPKHRQAGKLVEEFILKQNLSLLNSGSFTLPPSRYQYYFCH